MDLINYMEEATRSVFEQLIQDPAYDGIRGDEKARMDIMAIALNHLPPRYFVTEKGHTFSRLQELRSQFKTDILVELTKAIQVVVKNPR